MRTSGILNLIGLALLAACSTTLTGGASAVPPGYDTEIEYIEVGGLISASENVLIPLGPQRSYWYDGRDGSRWASDSATIPASTKILLWRGGMGQVDPTRRELTLRHVEGPRDVLTGWYGRITEIEPGTGQSLVVTVEDGRQFEVTGGTRDRLPRMPFAVVLGEDQEALYVLDGATELTVVREILR